MQLVKSLLKIGLATALLSGVGLALGQSNVSDPQSTSVLNDDGGISPHYEGHGIFYRLEGPPPSAHTGIVVYRIVYFHIITPQPQS